jgi:hypothetical protein
MKDKGLIYISTVTKMASGGRDAAVGEELLFYFLYVWGELCAASLWSLCLMDVA